MTVNDDVISDTVNSLKGVAGRKAGEIDKINSIIFGLNAVKTTNGLPPIDQFTDGPMSEERRQIIFDNCMDKAEVILDADAQG